MFVNEFSSSNFTNLTSSLGKMRDYDSKDTVRDMRHEDNIFCQGPLKDLEHDNLMPRIPTDISENVEYADNILRKPEMIGFDVGASPNFDYFNLNESLIDTYWDLNICSEANNTSKLVVTGVLKSPPNTKV